MLQHYFVSAWLPPEKTQREYYAKRLEDNLYSVGVIVPVAAIAPDTAAACRFSLCRAAGAGRPEEHRTRAGSGSRLRLADRCRRAAVLAAAVPAQVGGQLGVAIILLTVLIKAVSSRCRRRATSPMAKMKLVTPRMTKLREQYGNDRARLNQAMMELYKTERSIPWAVACHRGADPGVHFLYWVLLASVELRHAPF